MIDEDEEEEKIKKALPIVRSVSFYTWISEKSFERLTEEIIEKLTELSVENIQKAEPIIKSVVDCIAEKKFENLTEFAEIDSLDDLVNISILEYMDNAEITSFDKYDSSIPNQFDVFFDNAKEFTIHYDFRTDGIRGDLTLIMNFIKLVKNGELKAIIDDCHVL